MTAPRSSSAAQEANGAPLPDVALAASGRELWHVALALCTAASALTFAWAASVLPTRPGGWLAWLAGLLAAGHAATLAIVLSRPRAVRLALRALACASLVAAVTFVACFGASGVALVSGYGKLGRGLAVLLGLIVALLLLATLPIGIWGLRATRRG